MHPICGSHSGTQLSVFPLKTPAYLCACKIFSVFSHVLTPFKHSVFFFCFTVHHSKWFFKPPPALLGVASCSSEFTRESYFGAAKGRREQYADKPGIQAGRLGKVIAVECWEQENANPTKGFCGRTGITRWQKRSFCCSSYPSWCGL